jgi:hypothetical protein
VARPRAQNPKSKLVQPTQACLAPCPATFSLPVIRLLTSLSIIPPNVIPEPAKTLDHPILQSRDEDGSPLAGTVLADCVLPSEEQQLFVAALEKVATETTLHKQVSVAIPHETPQPCGTSQLLSHLDAMAEIDEQAGEFVRADQWRGLAGELRGNREQ